MSIGFKSILVGHLFSLYEISFFVISFLKLCNCIILFFHSPFFLMIYRNIYRHGTGRCDDNCLKSRLCQMVSSHHSTALCEGVKRRLAQLRGIPEHTQTKRPISEIAPKLRPEAVRELFNKCPF